MDGAWTDEHAETLELVLDRRIFGSRSTAEQPQTLEQLRAFLKSHGDAEALLRSWMEAVKVATDSACAADLNERDVAESEDAARQRRAMLGTRKVEARRWPDAKGQRGLASDRQITKLRSAETNAPTQKTRRMRPSASMSRGIARLGDSCKPTRQEIRFVMVTLGLPRVAATRKVTAEIARGRQQARTKTCGRHVEQIQQWLRITNTERVPHKIFDGLDAEMPPGKLLRAVASKVISLAPQSTTRRQAKDDATNATRRIH